jgi:subtilisin family serine protease
MIIGMGDTGLDILHCMFRDDGVPFLATGRDDRQYPYFNGSLHRKIAYYRMIADAVDEEGHGTHCAGSAAGALQAGVRGCQNPNLCTVV